jgi:hypothetical protein
MFIHVTNSEIKSLGIDSVLFHSEAYLRLKYNVHLILTSRIEIRTNKLIPYSVTATRYRISSCSTPKCEKSECLIKVPNQRLSISLARGCSCQTKLAQIIYLGLKPRSKKFRRLCYLLPAPRERHYHSVGYSSA